MKAAIYTRYGPPEVVRVQDVPKPEPTARQILVRVVASTVNRTDCGFRSAEYFIVRFFSGLVHPKQKVLGNEFSGVVEAVGADVKKFKAGDNVFGYNDEKFGCHAEYLVIGEDDGVVTMPSNLDFHQAAALTEGAHYALCDLRAAKIAAGQNILINGATGAIGSAAVQLAKYFGAHVTAVCGTSHLKKIKSLGADVVIDYLNDDFTSISDREFDIIFDAVGKSSFGKCKRIMKPLAVYMSTEFGRGAQNPFLALMAPFMGGKKVLFPLPGISQQDVQFLKERAENNEFIPLIDRVYPLAEIVEAYRYVETRQKIGNVIIQI